MVVAGLYHTYVSDDSGADNDRVVIRGIGPGTIVAKSRQPRPPR